MPRPTLQNELDALVRAIADFPGGVSADQAGRLTDSALPRRTLQRRLALLTRQGRLISEGRGKRTRYRSVGEAAHVSGGTEVRITPAPPALTFEKYLPLSTEGDFLTQAMRRPLQVRQPVGYNARFLTEYRPNETYYLSSAVRAHLHDVGKSPDGERPAGTYARQILNRLLIDLSWNSSRLEGNTYSLLQTERLLEMGEAAEGKDAREAQMILNHKAAIELLVHQADEVGFNRYTILNLHALLSDNLLPDPRAGGRLRAIPVMVSGTVYHPLEVPQLIEDAFQRFLAAAASIRDPFEQAFFAMVQLPYLQPFEDVNKRVSRLAANLPLIRKNLSPLSFVDVAERAYIDGILAVYELNRVELLRDVFVWAYERSAARYAAVRQSLGEPDPVRMRYRALIGSLVGEVVVNTMDKKAAAALIQERVSASAPAEDRSRVIEIAESEVMSLHEGNIARYRLRPSEFHRWKLSWH